MVTLCLHNTLGTQDRECTRHELTHMNLWEELSQSQTSYNDTYDITLAADLVQTPTLTSCAHTVTNTNTQGRVLVAAGEFLNVITFFFGG